MKVETKMEYTHLGKGLLVSYKHICTIQPSNLSPGYLPQRNENMCLLKDPYEHIEQLDS